MTDKKWYCEFVDARQTCEYYNADGASMDIISLEDIHDLVLQDKLLLKIQVYIIK